MKQQLSILIITLATLLLFSCDDKNKEVGITGIKMNKEIASLKIGDNEILTATLLPENSKGKIGWQSSNPGIATVTEGVVIALAKGVTIITASCEGHSAPCVVTVLPEDPVEILSIRFEEESISMNPGESRTLTPIIEPQNAETSSLIWTTANERVVTVTPTGSVQAIGHGKAIVTASTGTLEATCVIEVSEPVRNYKLVWSDEFDDDVLDTLKWKHDVGGAGWGNQEKQYYTKRSDNSYLQDGCLIIEAKKETYENCEYTSARLTSRGKMGIGITYGKMEARIALPAGKGTWAAFWMMPSGSVYGGWPKSGEIDIMEHVGIEPTMISHAVHTKARSGGQSWSNRVYYDNVENNFHTYTLEWINDYYNGNDAFIFYVDGIRSIIKDQAAWQTSTQDDWPFDQDFYVILNLAIGGNWGGPIDNTIFNTPLQMKVDYVRIYKAE